MKINIYKIVFFKKWFDNSKGGNTVKNKPSQIFKFFIVTLLLMMLIGTNSGYLLTNAYALSDSMEIERAENHNYEVINSPFLVYLPLIMKPILNASPSNISLSKTTIPENQSVGTEVGTFSTTDPDAGNTFTYQLVSGTGSTDNASFTISGNRLLTSVVFDYETKTNYSIRVRSTDQGGLYTEKTFTISVTDAFEDPPGVTIRPNYSSYEDDYGYIHIVGEVNNNTSANLRYVKITANLFNSSGTFLGSDYTFTELSNLPAWQKTCFDLVFYPKPPAGWTNFTFEPLSYLTGGDPQPKLTAYNHSGSYNATYGWYEIIGLVRNDGSVTYNYVQPIATLYDASDTVIGCDYTFTNTYPLSPGQSSSFELTFSDKDYSDAASYRLQVDGLSQ